MEPGLPQVQELKLKILEILQREGKSLVALNSMLYADEVNEQVVQRKMEIRDRQANRLIWNGVMAKALAIALNPVTVVDILTAATVDVVLLLSLSRLYGIPMTQTGAIDLLQKIALSMGGISASELLANLGLSGLKSLLGVATPVTGGGRLRWLCFRGHHPSQCRWSLHLCDRTGRQNLSSQWSLVGPRRTQSRGSANPRFLR